MTAQSPATDDGAVDDLDHFAADQGPAQVIINHPTSARFEPLLRAADVAEILDVTERTLRRYAERGLLRPVKMGGAVRYRAADVRAFLNEEPEKT